MEYQKALSAANLIWHIENTEAALDELETEAFQNLPDEYYEEIKAAIDTRLISLRKELENL